MDRLEQTPFGPDLVTGFAAAFPPETRFVVAFSGGADSLALLHAFAGSRESNPAMRLCAVHVDHHLHPDSTRWADRCREVCRGLSVELMVLDADLEAGEAVHADEGTARAPPGTQRSSASSRPGTSCAPPTPGTITSRRSC